MMEHLQSHSGSAFVPLPFVRSQALSSILPVLLGAILALVVGGTARPAHAAEPADTIDVPFDRLSLPSVFILPADTFVVRDSSSWEEDFVSGWPEMYREIAGEMVLVPPPRPNFSDSLIVAVWHGMTGCSERGGDISRITRSEDEVVIHRDPIFHLALVCLMEKPRFDVVRVATDDLPADATFRFAPIPDVYQLDPHLWYPLALGNSWIYEEDGDEPLTRIERVDSMLIDHGQSWYRLASFRCAASESSCTLESRYWLGWGTDALLRRADEDFASVDTLHAPIDRSVFSVRRAVDTLQTQIAGRDEEGQLEVRIYLNQEAPGDDRPWLVARDLDEEPHWDFGYFYGYGPDDAIGAIIEGDHLGDTEAIHLVLHAGREFPGRAGAIIEVAPHPIHDDAVIRIHLDVPGPAQARVFDAIGRLVGRAQHTVVPGASWTFPWREIGPTASGLYLLEVIDARGSRSVRSVIVAR